MNAREIAFLAVWQAFQNGLYIKDILEKWQQDHQPQASDYRLAKEIAYGTMQNKLALDYLAKEASPQKKLSLKGKEKIFLYAAIYQIYFLHQPLYAVVNESMKVAKKYFHSRFLSFLNAYLRNFKIEEAKLPSGNSLEALSIRYSLPIFFIEQLKIAYGAEKTIAILKHCNEPSKIHFRLRNHALLPLSSQLISDHPRVAVMKDPGSLEELTSSENYYIQNITPVLLFDHLKNHSAAIPKKVLDLCASPGGKTLLLAEAYPEAKIVANDVSQEKLKRLKENFSKFGLNIETTCQEGEYYSNSQLFDLVLIDAPCSNSGVLNKRPEARWRLNPEQAKRLTDQQFQLIRRAVTLLNPQGEIWYMTCSILPEENERLAFKIAEELELKLTHYEVILPGQEGQDGGFAALLSK